MPNTTLEPPEKEGLITYAEAAKRLNITRRTMEKWVIRYKLPHVRVGRIVRFNWDQLKAAIEERFNQNVAA